MKKITLLLAVMAMFAFTANAQKKGQMYAGGTLGFGVTTNATKGYSSTGASFNIAPEFGYFFMDNLKVGAELAYGVSGGSHSLLINPNVAYYLPIIDKLYYTPQFAIGGGLRANSGSTSGAFALSLQLAAIEYQPLKNMAFSLSLVNFSYSRYFKNNNVHFGFLTSPSVGFRYYF